MKITYKVSQVYPEAVSAIVDKLTEGNFFNRSFVDDDEHGAKKQAAQELETLIKKHKDIFVAMAGTSFSVLMRMVDFELSATEAKTLKFLRDDTLQINLNNLKSAGLINIATTDKNTLRISMLPSGEHLLKTLRSGEQIELKVGAKN